MLYLHLVKVVHAPFSTGHVHFGEGDVVGHILGLVVQLTATTKANVSN